MQLNKNLKLLVILGCLLFGKTLSAQIKSNAGTFDTGMRPEFAESISAEDKAKMRTMRMKKDLKLADDTAKLIYKVNLMYEKQIEDQMKSSPEMTEYSRAVLKRIKTEQDDEIMKLLNPEQAERYRAIQIERKKKSEEMKGSRNRF
jgi:hypothetical protein